MAYNYQVETPEVVQLDFEPAGLGSRSLAAIVDYLAIAGMGILVFLLCVVIYSLGAHILAIILGISGAFIIFWGYFVIYETLWSGQTPGKRAMRIRVLKTTGYPIGFVDVVIRNLIRIIDFLPSLYAIGIVTMFISPQGRRLGDYAAGTLVVKERLPIRLGDLMPNGSRVPIATRQPAIGDVDPDELAWDLRRITSQQAVVAREFLDRSTDLDPSVRARIGGQIAEKVAATIGARDPLDTVHFLSRVLYLLEAGERPEPEANTREDVNPGQSGG